MFSIKDKILTTEKTLFDTEQQIRKEKVIAAAAAYLSGRRKSKRQKRVADVE